MKEIVFIHKIENEVMLREESEIYRLLPKWRREKADRLKVESARLQSIAAGRLLSIAQEEMPQLSHYNISHAGEYVVVALADDSVGVDIECKEDEGFRVTRRMFTDIEKKYVAEDSSRFRDIWTIKESFLKCIGIGISVPIDSFTVLPDEEDMKRLASGETMKVKKLEKWSDEKLMELLEKNALSIKAEKGLKYYTKTARLDDDKYSLTICSTNPNLILDIRRVKVLV